MQARERRGDRALPSLSGQSLSGAMALLAVLGFATTALPSLQPDPKVLSRPEPRSAPPPAPVSAPGPAAPATPPAPAAAVPPAPSVPNHPPVVRRADFPDSRVTALGDLRLAIEAFDPEGDPIDLRTTWRVGAVEIVTPTPVLPRQRFARGDRIRASVVALDGRDESAPFETREVVVANAAPRILSFPTGFDATGAFVYPIEAIDPDGDRDLGYRLLEGPDGMRIEAREGVLRWHPRADQLGRHAVRIEVHDGRDGREVQAFTLDVTRPSTPEQRLGER